MTWLMWFFLGWFAGTCVCIAAWSVWLHWGE